MATNQNKTLIRRFFDEICNGRKLTVADELFAKNHVYNDPQIPGAGRGPEGMKQVISTYQTAFPDAHWGVVEMFDAENDLVVTRWIGSGTQKLELEGIPPTGKFVSVQGIYIHRIAGNKIVESWTVWDTLGMLQQLGVAPAIGAPKVPAERKN